MFKNVHNITAGAGAGKTTKLVEIISDLVSNKNADPGRMILTTYTDAAATEFRDKIKAKLSEYPDKSIAMDRAKIGTVHSIAGAYIRKYWYILGVSPSVQPMEDITSKMLMNRSLEEFVEGKDVELFTNYAKTFGLTKGSEGNDTDFWKDLLKDLFSKMRGYGFGRERIEEFKDTTLSLISNTFTQDGNEALLRDYRKEAEEYLAYAEEVEKFGSETAKTNYAISKEGLEKIKKIDPKSVTAKEIEELKQIKFNQISFDSKNSEVRNNRDAFQAKKAKIEERRNNIKTLTESLVDSLVPAEYIFISEVIGKIFTLLEKWIVSYEEQKLENALIDYSDMEEMFYRLLQNSEVIEDIKMSIDYLFVDEFQDSTPIQTKIFEILSNNINHTWFVGDRKQAIYGFTGSDSGLISELTESFPAPGEAPDANGNSSEILSKSHRSGPTLVKTANAVFTAAFGKKEPGRENDYIPEDEVRLEHRLDKIDPESGSLYHMTLSGDTVRQNHDALATAICKNIIREDFKDKYSESDIAILTRSNEEARSIAAALSAKGVKVLFSDEEFMETPEVSFIVCVLKLSEGIAVKKTNAEIRKIVCDENLGELTRKVVDEEYGIPYLGGLDLFASGLKGKSVIDKINETVARFDLYDYCGRWSNPDARRGNINLLRDAAEAYTAQSSISCSAADLRGFLTYLKAFKPEPKFNNRADGVKVLTYHKSKGLDWKIVVMCGLDKYRKPDSIEGITTIGKVSAPDSILAIPRLPNKDWVRECVNKCEDATTILSWRQAKNLGEERRLLYVGFTRAKDVVITTSSNDKLEVIGECCPTSNAKAEIELGEGQTDIWGVGIPSRKVEAEDDPELKIEQRQPTVYANTGLFLPESKKVFLQKYHSPSTYKDESVQKGAEVTVAKDFGERINIPGGSLASNVFGDCIHNIFANCQPGRHDDNISVARRTLSTFGINDEESADKVVLCIEKLYGWLEDTFGQAKEILQELPFRYTDIKGRVFSGNMDLVWETDKGLVLIDYKTFPGEKSALFNDKSEFWAGKYASQLFVYEEALSSKNHNVLTSVLYYPIEGLVLSLNRHAPNISMNTD